MWDGQAGTPTAPLGVGSAFTLAVRCPTAYVATSGEVIACDLATGSEERTWQVSGIDALAVGADGVWVATRGEVERPGA